MKLILNFIMMTVMFNFAIADDIYEYQDKNGATVFTNKPVKNAKKINLPPISVYASPMTKSDFKAQGYTNANTDKNIKKIYTKNYIEPSYGNETGRRQILSEELAHEKQGLTDAQQALLAGQQTKLPSEQNNLAQYQARIQALQDAVTEHQKNIEILGKQLGNDN